MLIRAQLSRNHHADRLCRVPSAFCISPAARISHLASPACLNFAQSSLITLLGWHEISYSQIARPWAAHPPQGLFPSHWQREWVYMWHRLPSTNSPFAFVTKNAACLPCRRKGAEVLPLANDDPISIVCRIMSMTPSLWSTSGRRGCLHLFAHTLKAFHSMVPEAGIFNMCCSCLPISDLAPQHGSQYYR